MKDLNAGWVTLSVLDRWLPIAGSKLMKNDIVKHHPQANKVYLVSNATISSKKECLLLVELGTPTSTDDTHVSGVVMPGTTYYIQVRYNLG